MAESKLRRSETILSESSDELAAFKKLARRVKFSHASGTKLRSKAPMRNITNVSALSVRSWLRDPRMAAMTAPASPQSY
jgi:hypothetical protein